ncbi:MAG: aminoacyl-tRNA hydrolase [Christensenellaceae bacterium]|jgi:PTH1 family peptidyl-tRNA hydrolase|nr:aminoacyl-tRNA hydrolase [Christensenellaceae bacterium]
MFIIAGLGNPGREYSGTRHNAGFMTLDLLADRWNIDIKRHHFNAVLGEGHFGGQKVLLLKPETFMNESGRAVREAMHWYKCEPRELLVIYDDIDIPLGDIRIRAGGSAGTHNGMRSVIYQLCYDDFPRIRVGIGQTGERKSLIAHVLGLPAADEKKLLAQAMANAADAAALIVAGDLAQAQAKYNKRPKKASPPKETQEAPPENAQGTAAPEQDA